MLMVLFIYKLNWRGIAHTPLLINLVLRLSPIDGKIICHWGHGNEISVSCG